MATKIDEDYARQICHDLKAPLSALKVIKDLLTDADQADLLNSSIERFEKIIAKIYEDSKLG
ncbi:MAG: hypothetical protein VX642_01510 [Bdellovibrionota bacterium]|nr:hypothetical protein [Bdellovibrionota bacterium]